MINVKEIAKTDLHCHLDGSLSPDVMERCLGRKIAAEDISVNNQCPSLTEYLTKFDLPLQCLRTRSDLIQQSYSFMKEIEKDRMKYIEVRFAPLLSVTESLHCDEVIRSVIIGLERGKQDTGIDYQVIVCAMRHFDEEKNMETLESAAGFLGKGVCAVDLAGDESLYPNSLFHEFFEEAAHKKMPLVIHSGETGSVENVQSAYEYGAVRIGHGLALAKDPDLMREIAKKGIGIEMCPTSNIQTKAVQKWEQYPLDKFLNEGIKVCINTDNRTVSNTTLSQEYTLIGSLYSSDDIIRQLLKNAEELALKR